jgi:hypothetical protein
MTTPRQHYLKYSPRGFANEYTVYVGTYETLQRLLPYLERYQAHTSRPGTSKALRAAPRDTRRAPAEPRPAGLSQGRRRPSVIPRDQRP